MRVVLFLDLDDTIFQTLPKCPPGEHLHPVTRGPDGSPQSYMTDKQRLILEMLSGTATIIPVTARSLDAFRRVDLPWSNLALLDFGAVILHTNGTPDAPWDAQIRPQALQHAQALHDVQQLTQHFIDDQQLGAQARIVVDFDMPLYLVIKHPKKDPDVLTRIERDFFADRWRDRFYVHRSENNLSLVPHYLRKEHAVRYVIERGALREQTMLVGMGDSRTDAGFLQLCDFILLPGQSQLAHLLTQR